MENIWSPKKLIKDQSLHLFILKDFKTMAMEAMWSLLFPHAHGLVFCSAEPISGHISKSGVTCPCSAQGWTFSYEWTHGHGHGQWSGRNKKSEDCLFL